MVRRAAVRVHNNRKITEKGLSLGTVPRDSPFRFGGPASGIPAATVRLVMVGKVPGLIPNSGVDGNVLQSDGIYFTSLLSKLGFLVSAIWTAGDRNLIDNPLIEPIKGPENRFPGGISAIWLYPGIPLTIWTAGFRRLRPPS